MAQALRKAVKAEQPPFEICERGRHDHITSAVALKKGIYDKVFGFPAATVAIQIKKIRGRLKHRSYA